MATGAAVLAVGASIVSRNAARKEQAKGSKQARQIELRVAELEKARRARRQIAARRLQEAALRNAEAAEGIRTSSVAGAVSSITTQTAANIGTSNLITDSRARQGHVLSRASNRAGRGIFASDVFSGIATGVSAFSRQTSSVVSTQAPIASP